MYMQFLIRLINKLENKVQFKSKNYKSDFCDIGDEVPQARYLPHCQKTEELKRNCRKYIQVSLFKALLSKTTSVTDIAGCWCTLLQEFFTNILIENFKCH